MTNEKILTLHPTGGTGSLLSKTFYEMIKQAIIEVFLQQSKATQEEINVIVKKVLEGKIEEDFSSVISIITLDLEARNFIARIPNSSPMQFQLKLLYC